jgi:hypothetical protein
VLLIESCLEKRDTLGRTVFVTIIRLAVLSDDIVGPVSNDGTEWGRVIV